MGLFRGARSRGAARDAGAGAAPGAVGRGEPPEVREVQDEAGTRGIELRFGVSVPPDALLGILWAPEHLRRLFPDIRSVRLVRAAGGDPPTELDLAYEVDAVVRTLRYTLRRTLHPEPDVGGGRIAWQELEGDLRRIRGGWEVRPGSAPGASDVIYRTFVDIARVVPTRLVVRTARRKAGEMVARVQAEARAIAREQSGGGG